MIQGTPNSCLTVCCAGSANQCAHTLALVSHVGQQREQLWVVFGKLTRARNDENESENELVNPHGLVTQQRFLKTSRKSVAVGLQPGDVAPTTAQMMRLLSKYFPASPLPPSPPLLCSLSLFRCVSLLIPPPLSLFLSFLSFPLF